MNIHEGKIEGKIRNPVATIGIFDGVHLGHQKIIEHLGIVAKEINGESVIVTLWPHPRIILEGADTNLRLLTTPEEKYRLLEKAGLDHLFIIPFTKEVGNLSPYKFAKQYLADKLGIKHLLFGYNNRFGKNREGNYATMQTYSKEFNFTMDTLPAVNFQGSKISSSIIRNLLFSGEVRRANRYLGYPYFIQGTVVEGKKLGRTLGFPTANLAINESFKLLPMDGVYAVEVCYQDKLFKGMMNIGKRPTINKELNALTSVEVHIIHFDQDIYNENICIRFLHRIRDEKKFLDIDSLKQQLESDKQNVISLFEKMKD